MPSKKKKYNARFPAGRIKKIMQTDEDVGKVAQAVPVIISKTLELFIHSLLTKTMQITSAKNAKTLSPSHMKQCILSESRFDFLKDLVKGLPDVSAPEEEAPTPPHTPAPIFVNSHPTQRNLETEAKSSPCDVAPTRRMSHDRMATMTNFPESTTHVPDFQMSVPTSYNLLQPNFYTEVDPSKLEMTNQQPMSNFTHTANIDEDYDN